MSEVIKESNNVDALLKHSEGVDRTIRRLDEMTILEREGQDLGMAREVTEVVLYEAVDRKLDEYFKQKRRGINKGGVPKSAR